MGPLLIVRCAPRVVACVVVRLNRYTTSPKPAATPAPYAGSAALKCAICLRWIGSGTVQLREVRADAIAVRIGVREQPPLQHAVGRKAQARHDVRWRERGLLDFGVVVERNSVELEHAHFLQRIVRVRPDLGQVERIDAVGGGVGLGHDLRVELPPGKLAARDRVEKIALRVVGIFARQARRVRVAQVANALLGAELPLAPEALAGRVDERKRVTREAVHETIAVGQAASFPTRWWSCSSSGPRGPAEIEFWLSATGAPADVVRDLLRGASVEEAWGWAEA